jgi:3-oxoacyl-[acyl-carrier protein] reductase
MSTAVVTGAAGAIGRAIAARFCSEGFSVLCVDQSDTIAQVCRELDSLEGRAVPLSLDLTEAGAPEAVADAASSLGGAGILVNNAGITRDARAVKMDQREFRAVIRVNATAPLRLAETLGPRLDDGGSIVNISSRAALGNFGQANYSAAKSALIGATRALAIQFAPRIRVNSVAPGLVATPMTEAMPREVLEKLIARVPAGRAGTAAEIAEVVAFLASERAGYVTGQTLLTCGGRSVAG